METAAQYAAATDPTQALISDDTTPAVDPDRARKDAANERRRAARAAKRNAATTEPTPEVDAPRPLTLATGPDGSALIVDGQVVEATEELEGPAVDPEPQPAPATVPTRSKPRTPRTPTAKVKAPKPTADPQIVELAGKLAKGDTVEIVYSGGLGVTLGKIYTAQFRALYPKGIVVKILGADGKPGQEVVRRLERVASLKRA